jgi:hypothetical protein
MQTHRAYPASFRTTNTDIHAIMELGKVSKGSENEEKKISTYNTRDSLVVTDPTTDLALTGLTKGERTGSRVLQRLWSYVKALLQIAFMKIYAASSTSLFVTSVGRRPIVNQTLRQTLTPAWEKTALTHLKLELAYLY